MSDQQEKLEYWSADRKFGAVLVPNALDDLLRHAGQAGNLETGGILMGRYNDHHDCATVDYISGPPLDSQQDRTTFVRGVKGLRAIVARFWTKERRYYLGEWHFHPGASPDPSQTDLATMAAIARDSKYACPEPILLILGGKPPQSWQIKMLVTQPDQRQVELLPQVPRSWSPPRLFL